MPKRDKPVRPALPVMPQTIDPQDVQPVENIEDFDKCLNLPVFHNLTRNQQRILYEIAIDLVSKNDRSDTELAADLGIDPSTVYRSRANVDFAEALAVLVVGITRARADKYLQWTEKAAEKGSAAAQKLLWTISGLLIERRSTQQTISIQRSRDNAESFPDMVDEFLIAMGTASYTADWITTRYNYLKSTGAF